jgi:hypothetical protein
MGLDELSEVDFAQFCVVVVAGHRGRLTVRGLGLRR